MPQESPVDSHIKRITDTLNLSEEDVRAVLSLSKFFILSDIQLNKNNGASRAYCPYGEIIAHENQYELKLDFDSIHKEQERCLIRILERR